MGSLIIETYGYSRDEVGQVRVDYKDGQFTLYFEVVETSGRSSQFYTRPSTVERKRFVLTYEGAIAFLTQKYLKEEFPFNSDWGMVLKHGDEKLTCDTNTVHALFDKYTPLSRVFRMFIEDYLRLLKDFNTYN